MSDNSTIPEDRTWLHIHIVDGDIYVFTDDAHWRDNPSEHWEDGYETSFEELDKDCYVGNFKYLSYHNTEHDERRVDIRIPLRKYGPVKYGKFGFPYQEPL